MFIARYHEDNWKKLQNTSKAPHHLFVGWGFLPLKKYFYSLVNKWCGFTRASFPSLTTPCILLSRTVCAEGLTVLGNRQPSFPR